MLANKLNHLTIPSSSSSYSSPELDFDFSEVFGPQTSSNLLSSSPSLFTPKSIPIRKMKLRKKKLLTLALKLARFFKWGFWNYNIALQPLSRGRHMCDSVCFSDGPSNFGPKWDAGSTSGFYESVLVLRRPKWDKGETLWVKNVINSIIYVPNLW